MICSWITEQDERIVAHYDYATALFDEATIQRHIGYLLKVLKAMALDAKQEVGGIDLLEAEERTLFLESWNTTETAYPGRCAFTSCLKSR